MKCVQNANKWSDDLKSVSASPAEPLNGRDRIYLSSSDETMGWVDPGQQQSTHQPLSYILPQQEQGRELEGKKQEKLVSQEKDSLVIEEKKWKRQSPLLTYRLVPRQCLSHDCLGKTPSPVLLLSMSYGME